MCLLQWTAFSSVKNTKSAEVHARVHARRKMLKEKLERK